MLRLNKSEINEMTAILKVKKPDYLGESMWGFRHGAKPIYAKILNEQWLKKFQARQIDVRPGDSIRARIKVTMNYDFENNLISTKYEVIDVLEVVQLSRPDQKELYVVSREDNS